MFILAEEFLRGKHLLVQAQRREGFPSDQMTPRPTIMIDAVALEIYFKCLYLLDHGKIDQKTRTHNLKSLFGMLLPETQHRIRAYFDPTEGQRALDNFRRMQRQLGLGEAVGLPSVFTFDFALFGSSRAFEWVRYAYERPHRPSELWNGAPIANAARRVILERNPSWETLSSNLDNRILPTSPRR
jgi:hypothetical protein